MTTPSERKQKKQSKTEGKFTIQGRISFLKDEITKNFVVNNNVFILNLCSQLSVGR